jgi:hypothetical protein
MIEFGSLEMFGTPTDFAVRLYSGHELVERLGADG